MDPTFDITLIGGGIVGTATAMALSKARPNLAIAVLEAEERLAAHQTGNNSGVIHSGLYYKPGSLKATLCVEGREEMYRFCEAQGVRVERCGKIVVATQESELQALATLEERGNANGIAGIRRIGPQEIKEFEPHCAGIAGLHVPVTGIVDYVGVVAAYGRIVEQAGGQVRTGSRVTAARDDGDAWVLTTPKGEVRTKHVINCAGLQSDRVAKLFGVAPGLQIVPFRGEYYEIVPARHHLVRNLIYPVPDPRFPFLGVHFTRMVKGGIEAGPNAVLAFKREGYKQLDFSVGDVATFATYGGFWKMAWKYWPMAMGEMYRSFSKAAFVKALQALVPEITMDDVHRSGAGVRAQALEPDGSLSDDFRIVPAGRTFHVLNAPSPAATASISIGRTIAERALASFGVG